MSRNYSHLDYTVQTILNTEWIRNRQKADVHLRLFEESVRRVAMWAKYTDETDYWFRKPVLRDLHEKERLGEEHPIRIKVEDYLNKSAGEYLCLHCLWALDWAYWYDMNWLPDANLPNPYAPMIIALQLGASIRKEHDIWCVDVGQGVLIQNSALHTYPQKPPFFLIDDMTYSIIDDAL